MMVSSTLLFFLLPVLHVALAAEHSWDLVDPASVPRWDGTTVEDLRNEYGNIFRHGNRNAASHRWATFLLDRAPQMPMERLVHLFSGFCAVSGSPVRPTDYSRYKLTLKSVVAGQPQQSGFMYYCCWPCVCDTQDWIKVDTRTVATADGPRKLRFAVIGNPCDHAESLRETFVQPFGFRSTTLEREAPEVRCNDDGSLEGATLSDHGFIIISLFFDEVLTLEEQQHAIGAGSTTPALADSITSTTSDAVATAVEGTALAPPTKPPQPGRMSNIRDLLFQDEYEFGGMCEDRKNAGYNSGMGEIFRRVASISPITQIVS
jgi:hypothetical protein